MTEMRVKNVAKNSFFSVFSQIMIIIAGFFSQRVINLRLGKELVGMNGVISNVIGVFSVSELGLSTVVVYHLYRALALDDKEQIASLMNLYRRAYYIISAVIGLLGILALPLILLPKSNRSFSTGFICLVYLLWLFRTIFGYLLSYKRSILIADQREYLSSLATMAISVFNYLSVILIVECTGNYPLALGCGIVFEMVVNFGLGIYADRQYPFLKDYRKKPVPKALIDKIFGDIRNIFVTRISNKLLGSTDNLILYGFVDLALVGLYGNYCLITQSINNIFQALSNALQPTMGHLAVEQDKERDLKMLRVMSFLFFLIASVALAGVAVVATPFVTDLWLGEGHDLPKDTVWICGLNLLLQIMAMPVTIFLNVSGLFHLEKRISMTAAVGNLLVSFILVILIGINGVLLGTTCAYLIQVFGKIYYYFRAHLEMPPLKFGLSVLGFMAAAILEALLSGYLVNLFYTGGNLFLLLTGILVCVAVPCVLNLLIFGRTKIFRDLLEVVRSMLGGRTPESL